MMDRLKIIFVMALIPTVFSSCKKQETQVPQPQSVQTAQPVQAAQAGGQPDGAAVKTEAAIEARSRNPFQSHIILMRGVEGAKKVKGPLECCEITLFKVVAVVAGADDQVALIQSPDNKRYIVKKGDPIGSREGKVVSIDDRGVTVRELVRDDRGNVKSSADTVIMLRGEKDADARK
ncbi:MAG: pilus assembly protein PilP [Deltaproteobacteria bacterium]